MRAYQRLDGLDAITPVFDAPSADEALARLGGPSLLRVPGSDPRARPRVVACLLHGNEDSGFRAVARLLASGARFPFDLWVVVGNVAAALIGGPFGHRYLEGQEDFNRIWGKQPASTPERRMAAEMLAELEEAGPEAVLDLHNTSGDNPPHAIVPASVGSGTADAVALAAACTGLVLRWHLSAHTFMEAMAPSCPAIAVECGIAGRPEHTAFAAEALDRFLRLDPVPGQARPQRLVDMRERVAVRPGVRFAFGGALGDGVDFVLTPDLDRANFGMLFAATAIGRVPPGAPMPLRAVDMQGRETTADLFAVDSEGWVRLTRDVTPVMMTRSVVQTLRDCLFYVARRR